MWKFLLSSSTFLKLYLKLRTVFQVSMDCLTRSVNLFPITVEAKQCFKKHCQVHSLSSRWTEHSPFKSCCWMPMGFLQVTQENIRVYFALRSYPVTWMKSSFQATDRHVTLNILSKSISPDFLNCGSKNQKGKKKKEKSLPVMLLEFPSKGADSWLNPEESELDCRWCTLLSPLSATAINQNHYRDMGQRKADSFKTEM